jgi:autotransporter-associated beta strand protein
MTRPIRPLQLKNDLEGREGFLQGSEPQFPNERIDMEVSSFRAHGAWRLALLFLLLIAVMGCLPESASAEQRYWTGAVSANWSNPDNWNPAGVPQNNDDLRFEGGANRTMINDIPGLTVSLGFWGPNFTLNGNPLTLRDTFHAIYITSDGGLVTINCALVLATNTLFDVQPYSGGRHGTLRLNADINLNGQNLILQSISPGDGGTSTIEMAGSVSGVGNVFADASSAPAAKIEFLGTAENTFSGTLVVRPALNGSSVAGVYLNKQAGSVVNNRLEVRDNAILQWRNSHQVGDQATVVIKDGSRIELDGWDEIIGSLVLSNRQADVSVSSAQTTGNGETAPPMGTLTVNDGIVSYAEGSNLPLITGRLNLPAGGHVFFVMSPNYAGLDIQAEIAGAGGFSKFGNAALLLKGTNTFGGTVFGIEGIIDVYNPSGFGSPAGGVDLNGGSVTLRNVTIANELLTARGQLPITAETSGSLLFTIGSGGWTGNISLESNLVLGGGSITLTGEIFGSGGLDFRGLGTAQLGGGFANNYTGKTLVRCPLLVLNKPLGVNAYGGPLEVGGGAGGPHQVNWNFFYQTPNTTVTLFANGILNLNGQVDNFGPIIFNGGTVHTGSGFLIAENTITANPAATTAVMNGNLSLGVSPAYLIVSNGVAEPDLLINATISGGNVRKQGQGTLTFTGPNTHTGYTLVEDGILHADHPSAFGGTSGNTIVWSGATIRLGGIDGMSEGMQLEGTGFQGTNGALQVAIGGAMYGGVSLSSPATINTLSSGSLSINSSIIGAGPLTKTGPGTLTLSGSAANTYTGGTIVSAGTLQLFKNQNVVAAPGNLTVGPATASSPATARWFNSGVMTSGAMATVNANSLLDLNGFNQLLAQLNLNDGGDAQTVTGTLLFTAGGSINIGTLNPGLPELQNSASISGKIALPTLDYLTFNVGPYGSVVLSPDPELVVSAAISGGGSMVKNGLGGMRLSGANTFNDSPPFAAGDLIINAGTVVAASNGALGGTAGWTWVNNGGRLSLINNITISGETLYLNSTNPAALDNPGGNNTWTGPVTLARDSGISVNQDWSLFLYGVISGSSANDLIKIGAGTLVFGGGSPNTYSGETFINEGQLHLAKPFVTASVPGALSIGSIAGLPASVSSYESYQVSGNIFVNRNGLLYLNGFTENVDHLYLADGGDVQTAGGTLILKTGGSLNVTGGANNNVSTISGNVDILPGTLPFNISPGTSTANQPQLDLTANVSSSGGAANVQKNGAGWMRLAGANTYTGGTLVNGGTLQVDGTQPQSTVTLDHDVRLQGIGTVGPVILVGGGVTISPGNSPGLFTTGNINASGGNGSLVVELNGISPGSGYDRIIANGGVNLTGLRLVSSLGFNSAVSNVFTIIANDGSDPVIGTFTGLPQGAKLYVGGELFQITYTGGTGNDVVLTRLVTPPPPLLKIDRLTNSFVRLTWPTNDPPFRLQTTTNLGATTWASALPAPIVIGSNNVVTNASVGAARFYRLINP